MFLGRTWRIQRTSRNRNETQQHVTRYRLDLIKKKHIHVGNHVKNNNLAFYHFNFHLKCTILSKWVSIQINCKYVIDTNKH